MGRISSLLRVILRRSLRRPVGRARRRVGARAAVSEPAGEDDRAVRAGRSDGHHRAHGRAEARRAARAARRDREQAGRGHDDRQRGSREGKARRLHAALRADAVRDLAGRVSDAAVRSEKGLRAGVAARDVALHPRRRTSRCPRRASPSSWRSRRRSRGRSRSARRATARCRIWPASSSSCAPASTSSTCRTRAAGRRSSISSAGR